MKRGGFALALSAFQAALVLALGLAGGTLTERLSLSATTLLLAAALLAFVLLAASARLLMPAQRPGGEDVAFVFPLHWGTFFPLGMLTGLLLGAGLSRVLGGGYVGGTVHTYELVGLGLGALAVLALARRRAQIPGAAFGLGYGLALPSAILLLDPANDPALTYAGHLLFMGAAAALAAISGYVRVKIVD